MTTGSKLSLLVVLAFVIVVGMFLTSYWDSARRVPQAPLLNTMQNVLDSASTPGTRRTLPGPLALDDVRHDRPLPAGGDRRPPQAVVSVPPAAGGPRVIDIRGAAGSSSPPGPTDTHNAATGAAPPNAADSRARNGTTEAAGTIQVVAKPGDTVSKWAAQHLGGNTKAARDAIIRANPSLAANPDCVVVGQTYVIPQPQRGGDGRPEGAGRTPPAPERADSAVTYTVKPGDTLWRIAMTQCGTGSVVPRIREINRDVIGGGDVLKPGMVLRLPPRQSNG